MGTLVTIGIPTFNRAADYLPQTIDSALKQTYEDIEVVIADNGSTDNTSALVTGRADPRIRYFRHDANIGPNDNFNFCLAQAKGDYFLMLHDDDAIDADFVASCMARVEENPGVGLVRTGTRIIDGEGRVLREAPNRALGTTIDELIDAWVHSRTSMYLCSTLFNTRALFDVGGFYSKRNLFQDVMAEIKVAARAGRSEVEGVKASFRQHSGERTFTSRLQDWCEDSTQLLDIIAARVNDPRLADESRRMLAYLNYNRVSKVENMRDRYRAYAEVFRFFGYRHTPLRLFINKKVKPPLRALRRRLRTGPAAAS